jgi:hypothetical protein
MKSKILILAMLITFLQMLKEVSRTVCLRYLTIVNFAGKDAIAVNGQI